ncbi:MAG: M23 family metallopeptidase [Oscillospiraceae bacterium]|nr:M23 family metallopeptidase [Oscillospiraceae bacterium]MBP1554427.1 M23 family metallopeptidase [Oscillospiraceae bacterium]MBQ5314246.1 M23 family metallopeptidase [Oscillospiraceae bacterium]
MKKTLFGSLGEMIKGNAVMIILGLCVVAAGALSFYTVNDINEKLEQQHIENPNSYTDSKSEEIAQDVHNEAQNVPLKDKSGSSQAKDKTESKDAAASAGDVAVDEAAGEQPAKAEFVLPVNGTIFAAFSGDELVYNKTMDDWRTHNGIDIRANRDNAVKAATDGTVTAVYADGMLGNVIEIDNGKYTVRYCGLGDNLLCKKGDVVKQGDSIGVVGEVPLESSEESHIHLEILKDGVWQNPDNYLG